MASNIFGIRAIHGSTGPHILGHSVTAAGDLFEVWSGSVDSTQVFKIHKDGDVILGPDSSPALATTATAGFLMIRGGNGVPTGVPANAQTGQYPLYWDYANNDLYVYDGGWVSVSFS